MYNKSIVWGACWFNESVDTVANFYINTTSALKSLGIKVYPVVFAAKIEHSVDEINYLLGKVKNLIILPNSINIFPNKNYGVAAISNIAYKLEADYTAVVDPDWSIEQFNSFVSNIVGPILKGEGDIVIPDIVNAAGRSNLFLGRTAITLFYPEYIDVIKTAFPGSFVASTNKIYEIVESEEYHFDWGGEWDIISLAINKGMKVVSMPVKVENIRHRPNNSKILDAFQIWKSILGNTDIPNRYKYVKNYINTLLPYNEFTTKMLGGRYSALEQIQLVNKYATTDTEKQLLYMILYPLAMLLGEIDKVPDIEKNSNAPYSKDEINDIAKLAIYCVQSALLCSNKSIEEINNRARNITNGYWGNWNNSNQKIAIDKITKCQGGLI